MASDDFSIYRPVGKVEAAAAQSALIADTAAKARNRAKGGRKRSGTAASPASPAPAPAPVRAPISAAEFIGADRRERRIPLAWPIRHDGYVYEAITVYRPSSREIGLYFEAVMSAGGAPVLLPMYRDDRGLPVPSAVLNLLDDDDDVVVWRTATDFLPDRLRRYLEAVNPGSIPGTGASPEPSPSA